MRKHTVFHSGPSEPRIGKGIRYARVPLWGRTLQDAGLYHFLCLLLALSLLGRYSLAAVPRAEALPAAGSFDLVFNLSNSPDEDSSQRPRAALAAADLLQTTWMEGVEWPRKLRAPAYTNGHDALWLPWDYIEPRTNADVTNPVIAVDSQGTVHVAWSHGTAPPYDIYYATRPASGDWSAPTNLTDGISAHSALAGIAIGRDDQVWVVWQTEVVQGAEMAVYITAKPAQGGTWSTPQIISPQPGWNLEPAVAVDANNNPHVVWRGRTAGNTYDIYHSMRSGGTWTTPENVSQDDSQSYWVRLTANAQGQVLVVWTNQCPGDNCFQTLFQRWDGSQWLAAPKVVSDPAGKSTRPAIGAIGCQLYVTWTDQRPNPEGPADIYFAYSQDCGDAWSAGENVSQNGTSSMWSEVVAGPEGQVHVFWQDMAPGQLDIFYARGYVALLTPPVGDIDIRAVQPADSDRYTRLLGVNLHLAASGPAGHPLEMRYANRPDFQDNPAWYPYGPLRENWLLAEDAGTCGFRTVYAQFRDTATGLTSLVYTDTIFYDGAALAAMALNDGKPYSNRTTVAVNSADQDQLAGCSGLEAMAAWEEGLTLTTWIPYTPQLAFTLTAEGPGVRTVHVRYRDRAGNVATLSDSIGLDFTPPISGAIPILAGGARLTDHLIIPVSGLHAVDNESGVVRVWLSNRCEDLGQALPYCGTPPCTYEWNLAYGGPPRLLPEWHKVCVRYEDDAGYGGYPGNMTAAYTATIAVDGITVLYFPLISTR